MGKRIQRPPVGAKLYAVCENRYYTSGRAAPYLEYCVVEGEVTGFFKGGYEEICLVGLYPKYRTPYRRRLSDVGKTVFYTPKEAALLAKTMTESYEQKWSWMNDPPLRRTWECYLNEEGEDG